MTTRFKSLGLAGRKGAKNTLDSNIITIEAPIVAVASISPQDTGIPLPDGGIQVISAFLKIVVPETTAVDKTINVGIFGAAGVEFLAGTSTENVGSVGTPVTGAINTSSSTIGYTLAGADFAELEATLVLTILNVGS